MPGLTRIAGFVALLAIIFGASLAAGRAIDPDRSDGESAAHAGGDDAAHEAEPTVGDPRGLATSVGGLTLELGRARIEAGRRTDLAFRVVDETGAPVTDFEVEHERRMHLILVRRDMSGYQHLHPRQAGDGTWHVPLTLTQPGTYRVFADFKRGGEPMTLGADVQVPGNFEPVPLPEPANAARADGYDVSLSGNGGELEFDVTRDGRRVTDIAPYLGARGHLVVLREGDLGYLHVHPDEDSAGVRRRVPVVRHVSPVPAVQARRPRPYGRVHTGGRRCRRPLSTSRCRSSG